MNRKMLKTYGVLKGYNVKSETYEWALGQHYYRQTGIIQSSKRATAPSIPTPL